MSYTSNYISKKELLKSIREAQKEYKAGKATKAQSIKNLIKKSSTVR